MGIDDSPPPGLLVRVRGGVRHPANWLELLRFGIVGLSGYAVNLVVFAAAFELASLDHRIAATLAFLVAVTNNFAWNRTWTFKVGPGGISRQAWCFLVVSLGGFALNLILLIALVGVGLPELPAQAIAVAAVMPVNFLGNRLWTFRSGRTG